MRTQAKNTSLGAGALLPSTRDNTGARSGTIMLRRSGLIFPRNTTFRTWESVGQELRAAANSTTWWLADWLAYGEAKFHDRYREAIRKTALSYQTLRNYNWVARQFELARRQDKLSFGHHAEVAALDRPEQDYWLRKAAELGWSRNKLRSEVRASFRERAISGHPHSAAPFGIAAGPAAPAREALGGPPGDANGNLTLALRPDLLARISEAARRHHLELGTWVTQVLDTAAGRMVQSGPSCEAGPGPMVMAGCYSIELTGFPAARGGPTSQALAAERRAPPPWVPDTPRSGLSAANTRGALAAGVAIAEPAVRMNPHCR